MTIPKKVQSRLREGLKKYQPTIEGHEEPLRGDGDPDAHYLQREVGVG